MAYVGAFVKCLRNGDDREALKDGMRNDVSGLQGRRKWLSLVPIR